MKGSSTNGILLFDSLERPMLANQAPPSGSSNPSTGNTSIGRNKPYEAAGIRTNFTTTSGPTYASNGPSYGSERDYPILDERAAKPHQEPRVARDPGFGNVAPLRFSAWAVMGGAIVGLGIGLGLYFARIGNEWLKLVSLPGDLFLRALQCLVVPLVFCVIIVVVADTVAMGRTSILRWQTAMPYILTSVLATVQGFVLALLFKSTFFSATEFLRHNSTGITSGEVFNMTMRCANGMFLASTTTNGALACIGASPNGSAIFLAKNQTMTNSVTGLAQWSLMDIIVSIANDMVPVNIFASLVEGSLLSIVLFAVPLGFTAACSTSDGQPSAVLPLLRQIRNIFLLMLNGLLSITPVAVVFLIASAVAKFDVYDMKDVLSQLGFLMGAFLIGVAVHSILVLPGILFIFTKSNPFAYIQHLFPAYVFAFGSASSIAALPVAIACIQRAQVSRTLAHIAMPFGTPINLNACGLYYPLAIVFMANMAGLGDQLNPARYAVLFSVSLLGCLATAPVPNAALVYLLTLWKTVFPSEAMPQSFAFIVAADFIVDRINTVVNVHGNAVVTRLLAEQIDETFEIQAAQHL